MKIKDLPKNKNLRNIKFQHPITKEACYLESQWNSGIWYKKDPKNSNEVFPLFLDDLQDVLELEIVN